MDQVAGEGAGPVRRWQQRGRTLVPRQEVEPSVVHGDRHRVVRSTLETGKEFIRAVEAKDIDAVARTLGDEVEQLFMHSSGVTRAEGVTGIVAGRRRGFCVADVRGRGEVLGYTRGIFDMWTRGSRSMVPSKSPEEANTPTGSVRA
ncbi:hypothetical protein [Myceligenerans cantabricum]